MFRLMVVDDSNIIRRKIQRCTAGEQFELVGTAANGAEALARYDEWSPDVVTMDLTMPEMDGIECIEKLIERDPDLRILVVSALSDKATGIEALQKGAQGFLCKPFSEEQLAEALTELTEDVYG